MNRCFRLALCSRAAFVFLLCLLLFEVIGSLPDISALDGILAGNVSVPVNNLKGELLFSYAPPPYGEMIPLTLDEVCDELIAATVAAEDRTFFSNPGYSPTAILRAFIQNLILRRTYSGASTITQQVVKNILIPPAERYARSIGRKTKEIILSAAVSLKYSKEEILTLYLNQIYYGSGAVGAEKAAENRFGVSASSLTEYQAAFIAGLPQAPNYYAGNPEAAAARAEEVLNLLHRGGCVQVNSAGGTYCP